METVRRICCEAEKVFDFENHYQQQMPQAVMDSGLLSQNEALASSAVRAAAKAGLSRPCSPFRLCLPRHTSFSTHLS